MKRIALFVALMCLTTSHLWAMKKETFAYVERDSTLYLDVYMPEDTIKQHTCFFYMFGGGFKGGERSQQRDINVFKQLCANGIVCVAIDYRLGLKNFEGGILDLVKRLEYSINIATEDLFSAVKFIIDNSEKFKVDTSKIILSGSSAGGIISLQADYFLQNGHEYSKILPEGFRFAGVISFSGALAKFGGKIKYQNPPAPTFFLHGTKDELVNYNKIVLFGKGMYGASSLAKKFKKNNWPYKIIRYENFGHEVAAIGFKENVPEILRFIDRYIVNKTFTVSEDETYSEQEVTKPIWNIKALRLYQKNYKPEISKDPVMLERLK